MTFGDTCENGTGFTGLFPVRKQGRNVETGNMYGLFLAVKKRELGEKVIRDVYSGKYYPVNLRSHPLSVRNLKRTVQKEDEIYDWSYDEKRNAGKIINGLFHKKAVPL